MNRLEEKHIEFLRRVASKPNSIHPLGELPMVDADAMAAEGLLIKYNKATGPWYSIGRYGAQYVKDHLTSNDSPELKALAVAYVKSKGYEEEGAAEKIVEREGVETILRSQAEEIRQERQGQKEVSVPMNERGVPEIKFRGPV